MSTYRVGIIRQVAPRLANLLGVGINRPGFGSAVAWSIESLALSGIVCHGLGRFFLACSIRTIVLFLDILIAFGKGLEILG
jgi:hypothetical protein